MKRSRRYWLRLVQLAIGMLICGPGGPPLSCCGVPTDQTVSEVQQRVLGSRLSIENGSN